MTRYHLAVDIGASSGRHMIGWIEDGTIRLKELYRFENRLIHKNHPFYARKSVARRTDRNER